MKQFIVLSLVLTTIICGVSQSQKLIKGGPRPKVAVCEFKVEGDGKIHHVQKATLTIKPLVDLERVRMHMRAFGGARITQEKSALSDLYLKKGQQFTFAVDFIVDSIRGGIGCQARDGRSLEVSAARDYWQVAKDGTLLTYLDDLQRKKEIAANLVEYQYDPDEPLPLNEQKIEPGQISDEKAKTTRAAIELLKAKGQITDMEAIELLHNRIELFIRTGVQGQEATDILWQAYKEQKTQGGNYWGIVDKIVKARRSRFLVLMGLISVLVLMVTMSTIVIFKHRKRQLI